MPPNGRFELIVLGIAQDAGLPQVGCTLPCCAQARQSSRVETPASIAVHDRQSGASVLIDATWHIARQLDLLQRHTAAKANGVDAIVLTHAHLGHYTGLMQFGLEAADVQGMPVYCSVAMATFLESNQPWAQLIDHGNVDLRPFKPGEAFEPLEDVQFTALPVEHRSEQSDTMAFLIRGEAQAVLYCPDIDQWGEALDDLLADADLAMLDGTFYDADELPGRSLEDIPHPCIVDTMQRLGAHTAAKPGTIGFTHFNHTNPVLHDAALRAAIEARGFFLAQAGLTLPL